MIQRAKHAFGSPAFNRFWWGTSHPTREHRRATLIGLGICAFVCVTGLAAIAS